MNLKALLIIPTIFLVIPFQGLSQNSSEGVTSLEQAIEIAIENNGDIQAAKNRILIAEEAKKGAISLPKTDFGIQYGQYNSADDELAWQLNQSFCFSNGL